MKAKQEKKLRWKEERREEAERQRIDIDAEEEALEAAEKQETLARTQALLLEQTDAMKSLRSAQRYAAILKVPLHRFGYELGGLMDGERSSQSPAHFDNPQTLEQQTAERQAQCAAIEEERKVRRSTHGHRLNVRPSPTNAHVNARTQAFRRQMLAQQAEADAQEQARRRARFEDAQAIAGYVYAVLKPIYPEGLTYC